MTSRSQRYLLCAALAGLTLAGAAPAQAQAREPKLWQASLEELMQVRVTTASRRAQAAEDVAAAVFVITRQDIRRSGLTTLPELLRLAPGVQVARVSASKWAISIRGFNDLFANKLLVLIDGRSIYTRAFGGVVWDAQDLMVGDIERIEVIRGPGGAMWGANAVNGVVNVITRATADTPGLAVELSAGTVERDRLGLRYGGAIGKATYRLFSQWSGYSDLQTATGGSAEDRWYSLLTGGRADLARGASTFMAQAQYVAGRSRPRFVEYSPGAPGGISLDGSAHTGEFSALGRWTRSNAAGLLQVQASHTRGRRREIIESRETATDLDLQYELPQAHRQAVVVGAAYRDVRLWTKDSLTLRLAPENGRILSAFVQDDVRLLRDLSLIVGVKAEHDGLAGWGVLPSARMLWRPTPSQRLWGAVSRARRTPAASDRSLRFVTPLEIEGTRFLAGFIGNPDYQPETLLEAEVGYRRRFGPANFELALFQGSYDGLPTSEPVGLVFEATPAPGLAFFAKQSANLMNARTRGVEVNANWTLTRAWRLSGSYSRLDITPRPDAASQDAAALLLDGHAPQHQWQLRSVATPVARLEFDLGLYHAGRLERLGIPAYTRLDARLEYKLTDRLSAIGLGRNLLDPGHQEFSGALSAYIASTIPRSAHLMLRWNF